MAQSSGRMEVIKVRNGVSILAAFLVLTVLLSSAPVIVADIPLDKVCTATGAAVGGSKCSVRAYFEPSVVTARRGKPVRVTLVLQNTGSCRVVFDTCQLKVRYASGKILQGSCWTGRLGSLSVDPGKTARYSWTLYISTDVTLGNSYWTTSLSGYACPASHVWCGAVQAVQQIVIRP